jgi:CBS domain-containing protein
MRVADAMRTKLVTVAPDLPVNALEALMVRERLTGVPVVERGALVGVLSAPDLARLLAEGALGERDD